MSDVETIWNEILCPTSILIDQPTNRKICHGILGVVYGIHAKTRAKILRNIKGADAICIYFTKNVISG